MQDAWQPQGIVVLGTPIGSEEFTRAKLQNRINEERRLWETIPNLPVLQCGWQILLLSASSRAPTIDLFRVWPPTRRGHLGHSKGFVGRDSGHSGGHPRRTESGFVARMGGLGLRSAERCAHAAFLASRADALHMIAQRNPAVAQVVVESMSNENNPGEESLAELRMATEQLDREGFWWRPSWSELLEGRRPEEHTSGEPGEWQRGWQYWSSSVSDSHYTKITMLSGRTAARRVLLRSHSGRNAGRCVPRTQSSPFLHISVRLVREAAG